MQTRSKGLLKFHKIAPRPELAAMGVARKLQVKPGLGRGWRTAWLVGQQQFEKAMQFYKDGKLTKSKNEFQSFVNKKYPGLSLLPEYLLLLQL